MINGLKRINKLTMEDMNMSMSKKDFIALADAIKEHNRIQANSPETPVLFMTEHLDTLADFCRGQNSGFMRGRWFGYIRGECGPGGGPVKKN